MFTRGDRVAVKDSRSIAKGTVGTVIATRSGRQHSVGVEFDSQINGGHSCDDLGMSGHCKWLKPTQLVFATAIERGANMSSLKSVVTSVSRYARKHLDKDVRAFVELGLLNDKLEITQRGIEFVAAYLLDSNKVELGKEARAEIEEIEDEENCGC